MFFSTFSKGFCWSSRAKDIIGRDLKFAEYVHHYNIWNISGQILKNKMAATGVSLSIMKSVYILIMRLYCLIGGHGGTTVTHLPPHSEVGGSNPRPDEGKLVVAYRCSGVYSTNCMCWFPLSIRLTSEAGVRFPARPQVGKLVVACRWSAVYSTEPYRTVCTGFLCPSNYPS